MVVDGTTGFLVPTGEIAALAAAFARLARDPGLRETLGKAGERRAREEFPLARHLDRMEALFRTVAG
jgi:glycosyltransferase involved in cell wall biosynthesis